MIQDTEEFFLLMQRNFIIFDILINETKLVSLTLTSFLIKMKRQLASSEKCGKADRIRLLKG